MADFQDLDPDIRCFALVGQFLQTWSIMEYSLHIAIGAALSIEPTRLQILCANMRFREKVYILGTLIDVAPTFESKEKAEIVKTLRTLADYSGTRNMMAHGAFGPDPSKTGVEFFIVKAKGKFSLPNTVWSVDRFQIEGAKVDQFRVLLGSLMTRFRAQLLHQQNYSAALQSFLREGQDDFVPTPRSLPLTLSDFQILPVQAPPDNDQAKPEANPQMPDKPQQ